MPEAPAGRTSARHVARHMDILSWLPSYQRQWADALAELHEELAQRGVALLLSRVHPGVRETLDRSGGTARIGEHHIYRRSYAAAMAFAAPGEARAPGGAEITHG